MSAPYRRLFSAWYVLAVTTLLVLMPQARAVAPAAPTNVKVDMSRAIDADVAASNGIAYNSQATYLLRWTDNAFDKEGIRIEVRFGNAGPFTTLNPLMLSNDFAMVVLPHFPKDTLLQFLVTAYKFNGAKIEYAYSPPVSYTLVDGSATFAPPTGLTAELVGDGVIKFKWADNSNNEIYHQILFKKAADASFAPLETASAAGVGYFGRGFLFMNTSEASLRLGLKPGETYNFQIRATRTAPNDGVSYVAEHVTNPSNTVTVTIPALVAPTNLIGSVVSETSVKLSWDDKSTNETGYQVEYMMPGEDEFEVYGTVGANVSSATVPTPPNTTVTWRVRAIYKKGDMTAAIESEPTNNLQLTTSFPAPTNLTATTSPTAGSVELTWTDNSSAESGFEIRTRPKDIGADWAAAMTVPAGTTSATVSSRLNSTGTATLPLEIDSTHEFTVHAYYGNVYSGASNTATADAKPGFTSRYYNPATVGVAYNSNTQYVLQTSGGTVTMTSGVKNWNIANLGQVGLSFDPSTGIVSGTPSKTGVFTFPMSATFDNGWTANATFTLRILRPREAVTSTTIPNTTIATNSVFQIPLAPHFSDPESERAVRLETTKGNIDILLYPSLAPQAVDNFMAYVKAGDYDGVVFHRSIPGFVIQGGGFKPVATPKSYTAVQARPSPKNEPGISNVTGTIAAAKLGNNPNSATHDFFLNLENNNSSDPNSLDNQNGGFTVFGRVATSVENRNQSLAVVYPVLNLIANLPRGNYVDGSPSGSYNAALDKRILVDNSPASFTDWPMDVTGSAPADMDVLKNVFINKAYEIPVLNYSLVANSAEDIVSATIADGVLQLRGLKAGQAQVTVKATDLENTWSQQFFVVTVAPNYKPPVISRHPVSVAVAPGGKATFTVAASGTALNYQWRKENGEGVFEPIAGATKNMLAVSSIQAEQLGNYDVLVWNDAATLTSNPANLAFKAGPVIEEHPEPVVANVGGPIEMAISVKGAPAPTIAWLRGTAVVAGQKNALLKIGAAKLTDGGVYTARATNPSGKATSAAANVYVVDPSTVTTTVKPGGKAVLKAGVSGPVTSWQWYKEGVPISDEGSISGTSTAVLTIKSALLTDSGNYTCEVTLANAELGPLVTGVQKLAVVVRPTIADYTAAAGVVGFNYDFTVPYDDAITNTPTKFTISHLPPGLKYDPKTGRITGRPLKAGRFLLGTVLNNVAGNSNVAIGTLDILPMSQYGVGTFIGAIQPSTLNANKGGRVDLTILDSGTYTGKLWLGSDTYPIAGQMTYFPGGLSPQSQIIIQRKGKSPVLLYFVVDESDGDIVGQITDGLTVSSVNGFRQTWHANWNPSGFFAGNYNAAINLKAASVGNPAVPQGSGYATIIATTGGTVLNTIKMADGTGVTSSSIVGPGGQFLVFQMLYKNTGSLLGTPSFGITNLGTGTQKIIRVSGDFRWIKDVQIAASERSYKPGFPAVEMDFIGRIYRAPATGTRVMDLPPGGAIGNALLDFSGGGLDAALTNPDINVTVPANNVIQVPAAGSDENPARVKISLNIGSGLYSGSFELMDPNPPVGGIVKRTGKFQGLLVPNIPLTPANAALGISSDIPASLAQAPGHFLLPQLPSAGPPVTTINTSPILSGKVELKAQPITITSITANPVDTAVNPGGTYAFTVVASGDGTLTYQWRRNGVNVSGATGTTYTIGTVAESHQGSYDVVVSNGSTSTVSSPLVLNVNDPVSNIGVARTPSGSVVGTGQTVVFTATPQGTAPFSYQWFKGGQEIQGATSSTYVINSAEAAEHDGSYTVKVSNMVTTSGLMSGSVSLTVVQGVANVVASRTPSSTVVNPGATVTFQVTADGAGTLSYQWRRNGQPLDGATGSSYTISPVGEQHTGNYDVVVSSTATPAGVASNIVNLEVSNAVSNVVASRNPADSVIAVGENVTFSVTAGGSGPFTYQWRKGGQILVGETDDTLSFAAAIDSGGLYDVIVYNDLTPDGVVSNEVALAVAEPVSNTQISPAGSVNIAPGGSITFTVSADGTIPFTYQWRKGGMDIQGANDAQYQITSAEEGHSGDYDCVVTNAVGSQTSSATHLTVTP